MISTTSPQPPFISALGSTAEALRIVDRIEREIIRQEMNFGRDLLLRVVNSFGQAAYASHTGYYRRVIRETIWPHGIWVGSLHADFLRGFEYSARSYVWCGFEALRAGGGRVIHVHLGFAPDYSDHPKSSPLLGGARAAGILKLGTSSTEIAPEVAPKDDDLVVVKKRISAFYGTDLEQTLHDLSIEKVLLTGVATDLAVQSAARDAHDRDFEVEVVANCCAAANDADHEAALATMKKFAAIR